MPDTHFYAPSARIPSPNGPKIQKGNDREERRNKKANDQSKKKTAYIVYSWVDTPLLYSILWFWLVMAMGMRDRLMGDTQPNRGACARSFQTKRGETDQRKNKTKKQKIKNPSNIHLVYWAKARDQYYYLNVSHWKTRLKYACNVCKISLLSFNLKQNQKPKRNK